MIKRTAYWIGVGIVATAWCLFCSALFVGVFIVSLELGT